MANPAENSRTVPAPLAAMALFWRRADVHRTGCATGSAGAPAGGPAGGRTDGARCQRYQQDAAPARRRPSRRTGCGRKGQDLGRGDESARCRAGGGTSPQSPVDDAPAA